MNNMPANKNRRVLVVDDNRSIHDDFRKILSPATAMAAASDATEAAVFGHPTDAIQQTQFEVDSAYQGQEGVLLVKKALEAGLPYGMAFVDVRMPPGWDGVETTRKIWELDPNVQVALCTAYSDYSWGEIFEKLGHRDGWLILKKPFDAVEALQLAHALTEKWWLHQQSKRKMEELESRVAERTGELQQTNHTLQTEVVEHTRAEEELRASQQIIEGIINAMPVKVFWKDKNLVYLGCNAAFARDAGFADPKDIIGKDDYQMGWRDRAELYRGDDRQVIESGCSKLLIEEPLTSPGGKIITILTSKIPLLGSNGEISGLLGTYLDITERKRAEELLRLSEERFRIAAETTNDVIYEWDLKQSLEWPGKIDDLLGYEPGEFPRTMDAFVASVHPEDSERTMAAIQTHLEGGGRYVIEYRVRRKDGVYRWWSARGAVARTPDGTPTRWIGSITDITERKQAEERLTQERDLSEAILNNMPGLFYLITEKGRFLRWNRQFETVSGYSGEEIARMHPLDIVPAEHKGLVAEQILQVFKTGRGSVEANLLTKQGERLPFYFTGGTVIVDGQPCLAGTGIDITERKRAEAASIRLAAIIESSGDAIIGKDMNSIITSWNKGAEKMFGHAASDMVGTSIMRLIPAGRRDEENQILEKIKRGESVEHFETLRQTRDGRLIDVSVTVSPIKDATGKVIGVSKVARDITERKRAEAEHERLAAILEATTDLVSFSDPAGKILYYNRAGRKLLGIGLDEDVTKLSVADLIPNPANNIILTEGIPTAIRQGLWSGETILLSRSGQEIPVSQVILAHKAADGKLEFLSTIMRDLTERKRLEAQLFQSQKLESVGKLAGGIAHEFNSILTAIIGQSELLREDLPAGSPLAQNAIEISKAADRAAVLTRQLLAYGRKQLLRPEALNLNKVITSMDGVLGHLMGGESVDVKIVPAAGLQLVKADAGQIEQVIMNLAMNARDAMPNGGKLTLETANVTLDQDSVGRYPELKPGGYVMLAISDTGSGMSEKVKARVFEPFFTTKDVGQGTGLGLSTCYGIIKQSGGHISVYSEPGRGTTFKIYLPQVEPPTKIPIQRLDSPDLPRGTETILLVEDDPALREMAATLLRRLGYTVLAAANGIEALSLKPQRDNGHIDLLFTDVVMPHMSGKELSERVRALYPHTRTLFTSAYTENAIVRQGVLNPGVALLQKPFTPSALAHKLREVLDQPGAPKPDPAQKTSGFTKISDEAKTPVN